MVRNRSRDEQDLHQLYMDKNDRWLYVNVYAPLIKLHILLLSGLISQLVQALAGSVSVLVLVIFHHFPSQNASSSDVLIVCLVCTACLRSAHVLKMFVE